LAEPGHLGRPYLVRSLQGLDAELLAAVQGMLPAGAAVRSIMVVPPQEHPARSRYRYGPAQALVFQEGGLVHAQTAAYGQPARALAIPAARLMAVSAGLFLLYGRLDITYAPDTDAAHLVVEFNTTGWDLLRPGLMALLDDAGRMPPVTHGAEKPLVDPDDVDQLPLKFANGLRIYCLAPGEQLLALAFEPGLWSRRWLLWRRQDLPAATLALTDRRLALIEEERSLSDSPSYGWTFTFVPRHILNGMRATPTPLGRLLQVDMGLEGASAAHQVELTADVAASWGHGWRALGGAWDEGPLEAGDDRLDR